MQQSSIMRAKSQGQAGQTIVHKCCLSWRGLTLTENKENKHILHNLSGSVKSGSFMTIMGPSGAGKSSLLSILTARLRKGNNKLTITGEAMLNNRAISLGEFSQISAYVQQDDQLFSSLTVRQTFMFKARLKIWQSNFEQQQQLCENLISKLNLAECADNLIGDSQFNKCISGGQKKRVSIGVELLSNPSILILDQPTSGLDSHNALKIIKLLSGLARNDGKLILATLHQPSTLMFQNMDELYLMKAGQCVYQGKADLIIGYMQKIGITVDLRMNPADFFMLEISKFKQDKGYITPLNVQNNKRFNHHTEQVWDGRDDNKQLTHKSASFLTQFSALSSRSFKSIIRTPSNQMSKFFTTFLLPALIGLLYLNIGEIPQPLTESYLLSFLSFLFMSIYFSFAMNTYDTILIFPSQKQIVLKQISSNLYTTSTYYFSRLATQLLACVVPAVVGSLIIYLMVGLQLSNNHFILYMGIYVLASLQGYFFGMLFGVLCKDNEAAVNLLPLAVIPILCFGGLVVNLKDVPSYISWAQYISPLRHLFLITFQDQPYAFINLPKMFGLDSDPKEALYWLFGLLLVYAFGSLLLLALLKKKL